MRAIKLQRKAYCKKRNVEEKGGKKIGNTQNRGKGKNEEDIRTG